MEDEWMNNRSKSLPTFLRASFDSSQRHFGLCTIAAKQVSAEAAVNRTVDKGELGLAKPTAL